MGAQVMSLAKMRTATFVNKLKMADVLPLSWLCWAQAAEEALRQGRESAEAEGAAAAAAVQDAAAAAAQRAAEAEAVVARLQLSGAEARSPVALMPLPLWSQPLAARFAVAHDW